MTRSERQPLRGIIPPLVTPFDRDGKVLDSALAELVEFVVPKVHGLFICGTYGSGPLMNRAERKHVAEVIVEANRGRVPIIVHVGASEPFEVLELARHAQDCGAAAVAAVPPIYYNCSDDDVIRFFDALMETVELPVYVYNNPKTVGYPLSPRLLATLAERGLAGIKDSSFDLLYFYQTAGAVTQPNFNFVIGTEALIIPTLLYGATASVAGLANALPEPVSALYDAVARGDLEAALPLQERVVRLREIQHYAPSIPAIHAMLRMRGIDAGYPRLPFAEVSDEVQARMKSALKEAGAL